MLRIPALKFSLLQFTLCTAFFFTTIGNLPLWGRLWPLITPHDLHSTLFALSAPLALFIFFNLFFSLLAWPYLRKPLFALFFLVSAACSYFMANYNVVIDRSMVQNLFETNQAELSSYFSLSLLLWIVLLGVLPTLLLLRGQFIQSDSFWKTAGSWCGNFALSCLIFIGIAFFFYKDYASLVRNNRVLNSVVLPANVLRGTYSYFNHRYLIEQQPLARIGEDARREATAPGARPKLFVVVVGETARARNFQLNGYARPTNPRLSQRDVIAFQNATSCGTATAISLPCMFSRMSREDFNEDRAANEENLVDVVQRAGVSVLWRDNNNGGCKGVCARVPSEEMPTFKLAEWCKDADGTCYDDVLLDRLDEKIQAMPGDTLIVLHQLGSHGPTYYARYPDSERVFTPTCDTNQIQNCDQEALVNTYDNSLLYTDKMLDNTIALLQKFSDSRDVAMLYLSDHGESLGEKGFYLHGTPYMMAPEEQKHIPMLLWLSPTFAGDTKLDLACLKKNAQQGTYSQDNLFHSVLGMFAINTREYQRNLDFFAACPAR